ncbi:MAG: calcium-binding protein [Luteimonas sp.]
MSDQYRIVIASLPLNIPGIGNVAGHNYLVLLDPNGNVVSEINGLATGSDGTIRPIGIFPSDRLKVYVSLANFYDPDHSQATLFSGSLEEVTGRWEQARQAADVLNSMNLPYPPIGIVGAMGNSNAVATTLTKAMGLKKPDFEDRITPTDGRDFFDPHPLSTEGVRKAWEQWQEWAKDSYEDTKNWWSRKIGELGDAISDLFDRARNWRAYSDPLVLDLDGDGIETVRADGRILFDHNSDGVSQGTGWVSADDGMLVFDRNGNGIIDSGRELFGTETEIDTPDYLRPTMGDTMWASSGFQALRSLDQNEDLVFNALDNEFNALRVWRDLDQDGHSDAGELFTFEQLGIVSIDLRSTATNRGLGNGNTIATQSTVTRQDGSSTAVGDLIFGSNTFYREFKDPVSLTEEALTLPELQGAGMVRDLREAASISSELALALKSIEAGVSREQMMQMLDGILLKWANTSTFVGSEELAEGMGLGFNYLFTRSRPPNETVSLDEWSQDSPSESLRNYYTFATTQHALLGPMVQILEMFTGQRFFASPISAAETDKRQQYLQSTPNTGSGVSAGSLGYYSNIVRVLSDVQIDLINQSYAALKESVYMGLVVQTRLKNYLSGVSLDFKPGGGLGFSFVGVDELLREKATTNALAALDDLYDLKSAGGRFFADWSWSNTLFEISELATDSDAFNQHASLLFGKGVLVGSTSLGTDAGELLLGTSGADTLNGQGGDDELLGGVDGDILNGGEGNDTLYGGRGNDTLQGGAGNDVLEGGDGDDVLTDSSGTTMFRGGAGNDTMSGTDYWSRNTFEGGTGNDTMNGQWGKDTYVFNLGDGQDVIRDNGAYSNDAWYADTLQFGAGIAAADIQASRSGNDLVLAHANGTDKITLKDWFTSRIYGLESVVFADGTTWSWETLTYTLAQAATDADQTLATVSGSHGVLHAGGGNDTLTGNDGNDQLFGDAGNDTLQGGAGNDVLEGGDGDDVLTDSSGTTMFRGGAGNDTMSGTDYWSRNTFEGGTGNDTMNGQWGKDTYVFNLGDGQDVIRDNGAYSNDAWYADTLQFGAGIDQDDIWYHRVGDDLLFNIIGQQEQVTVKSWFASAVNKIELVTFADGSSLTISQVESLVAAMASYSPPAASGYAAPAAQSEGVMLAGSSA